MINECRGYYKNCPNLTFTVGRIEALPFPDKHFDVVLCLGAFEYLLKGSDALREISRVLDKDGVLILSMHNTRSP